jgi:hypothetical protein
MCEAVIMSREDRLAANEARFRLVNERLEDAVLAAGAASASQEFVCECADIDCAELLPMSLAEYERIRQDPELFIVVPEHVCADVERVVSRRDDFVVVRKQGEAAEVAAETDPRS